MVSVPYKTFKRQVCRKGLRGQPPVTHLGFQLSGGRGHHGACGPQSGSQGVELMGMVTGGFMYTLVSVGRPRWVGLPLTQPPALPLTLVPTTGHFTRALGPHTCPHPSPQHRTSTPSSVGCGQGSAHMVSTQNKSVDDALPSPPPPSPRVQTDGGVALVPCRDFNLRVIWNFWWLVGPNVCFGVIQ